MFYILEQMLSGVCYKRKYKKRTQQSNKKAIKVSLNFCYMNLEPDSSTGFKACWLANKEKKLTDFKIKPER